MATVKLVKAPPPYTAAEDPETGTRFKVGATVEGVEQEVVDRVTKLDGFEFDVTATAAGAKGVVA